MSWTYNDLPRTQRETQGWWSSPMYFLDDAALKEFAKFTEAVNGPRHECHEREWCYQCDPELADDD